MSGRYVSRVFESDLSPELKFTAAVLASFADDDGYRIWPAVGEVAHLRGLKERQVQVHMKELREMTILEIVKPATQWWPAHYRMVLEKLPWRAPYQPPDRQPWLGSIGESPPGNYPGVQSTAPLPGVQPSAPGVQPTAPDPSLDPSLRTHILRAREDVTNSGVQPTAPLSAADAGEGRLPLIGRPARRPGHTAHAWCGRICVPKFLHKDFKRALGGPLQSRPGRMRTFYAETLAAIPAVRPIGDEPVKFWRAAFAGWVKTFALVPAPVAPPRANVWTEILQRIEAKIPRHEFYTWFRGTTLVEDQGEEIQIAGPEPNPHLHIQWIQKHYTDVVTAAIADVRPGARVTFIARHAERKQA